VIRQLVGPQVAHNSRTPFWVAFQRREQKDIEGVTDKRQNQRKEAAKKLDILNKEIESIINRGGIEVFMHGIRGAVRREQFTSQKNNLIWKIVEVSKTLANELKVGKTSPLNMSAFPDELRKAFENMV